MLINDNIKERKYTLLNQTLLDEYNALATDEEKAAFLTSKRRITVVMHKGIKNVLTGKSVDTAIKSDTTDSVDLVGSNFLVDSGLAEEFMPDRLVKVSRVVSFNTKQVYNIFFDAKYNDFVVIGDIDSIPFLTGQEITYRGYILGAVPIYNSTTDKSANYIYFTKEVELKSNRDVNPVKDIINTTAPLAPAGLVTKVELKHIKGVFDNAGSARLRSPELSIDIEKPLHVITIEKAELDKVKHATAPADDYLTLPSTELIDTGVSGFKTSHKANAKVTDIKIILDI